jgi:hypothetical protein
LSDAKVCRGAKMARMSFSAGGEESKQLQRLRNREPSVELSHLIADQLVGLNYPSEKLDLIGGSVNYLSALITSNKVGLSYRTVELLNYRDAFNLYFRARLRWRGRLVTCGISRSPLYSSVV